MDTKLNSEKLADNCEGAIKTVGELLEDKSLVQSLKTIDSVSVDFGNVVLNVIEEGGEKLSYDELLVELSKYESWLPVTLYVHAFEEYYNIYK